MSALLDLLSLAGDVLDTPGSVVRGLAARQPGRAFGGVLDPANRVGGRELLQTMGLDPGDDIGGILAGLGTEIATDPLNWLGGTALTRLLGVRRAARAGNLEREARLARNAASQEHNLQREFALSKQADVLNYQRDKDLLGTVGKGSATTPSQIINPNVPDPELARSFQRSRLSPTPEQLLSIQHDPVDWVAKTIADLNNVNLVPAHPIATKVAEAGGAFRPYSFAGEVGTNTGPPMIGFVLQRRPEMLFMREENKIPTLLNALSHEAIHSLVGQHPEVWPLLQKAVGSTAAWSESSNYFDKMFGKRSLDAAFAQFGAAPEEGAALLLGRAMQRAALRQRFPVVDAAFGVDRSSMANEAARFLRTAGPPGSQVTDPHAAMRILFDFLSGDTKRSRALVPVSEVTSSPELMRSFAPPPRLSAAEENLLAGGYLPTTDVPPYRPPPRVSPLLTALAAGNTMARRRGPFPGFSDMPIEN